MEKKRISDLAGETTSPAENDYFIIDNANTGTKKLSFGALATSITDQVPQVDPEVQQEYMEQVLAKLDSCIAAASSTITDSNVRTIDHTKYYSNKYENLTAKYTGQTFSIGYVDYTIDVQQKAFMTLNVNFKLKDYTGTHYFEIFNAVSDEITKIETVMCQQNATPANMQTLTRYFNCEANTKLIFRFYTSSSVKFEAAFPVMQFNMYYQSDNKIEDWQTAQRAIKYLCFASQPWVAPADGTLLINGFMNYYAPISLGAYHRMDKNLVTKVYYWKNTSTGTNELQNLKVMPTMDYMVNGNQDSTLIALVKLNEARIYNPVIQTNYPNLSSVMRIVYDSEKANTNPIKSSDFYNNWDGNNLLTYRKQFGDNTILDATHGNNFGYTVGVTGTNYAYLVKEDNSYLGFSPVLNSDGEPMRLPITSSKKFYEFPSISIKSGETYHVMFPRVASNTKGSNILNFNFKADSE